MYLHVVGIRVVSAVVDLDGSPTLELTVKVAAHVDEWAEQLSRRFSEPVKNPHRQLSRRIDLR